MASGDRGWTDALVSLRIGPGCGAVVLLRQVCGQGNTALHMAATNGNVEMIKLLLLAGADIRARDARGRTALHCAALSCKAALVSYLVLEAGSDAAAKDAQGRSAREMAWQVQYGEVEEDFRAEVIFLRAKHTIATFLAEVEGASPLWTFDTHWLTGRRGARWMFTVLAAAARISALECLVCDFNYGADNDEGKPVPHLPMELWEKILLAVPRTEMLALPRPVDERARRRSSSSLAARRASRARTTATRRRSATPTPPGGSPPRVDTSGVGGAGCRQALAQRFRRRSSAASAGATDDDDGTR